MRNDSHDAVAVVLNVRSASQPAELDEGDTAGSEACSPEDDQEPRKAMKRKVSFRDGSDSEVSVIESAERGASEVAGSGSDAVWPDTASQSVGETDTEAEKQVKRWAAEVHKEMRQFWEEIYETGYDAKLLSHLSRLLFMKRKRGACRCC